jgi:hypothetical protein
MPKVIQKGKEKRKEEGNELEREPRRSKRIRGQNSTKSSSASQLEERHPNNVRRELSNAQFELLEKCIRNTPVEEDIAWDEIGRKVLKLLKPEDQKKVKDVVTSTTRSGKKLRYSAESMEATAGVECTDVYNRWTNKKKRWEESQQSGGDGGDVPPSQRSESRTLRTGRDPSTEREGNRATRERSKSRPREDDRPTETEEIMASKERTRSSSRGKDPSTTTRLAIRSKSRSQAPSPPARFPNEKIVDVPWSTIVTQPESAERESLKIEARVNEERKKRSNAVLGKNSH